MRIPAIALVLVVLTGVGCGGSGPGTISVPTVVPASSAVPSTTFRLTAVAAGTCSLVLTAGDGQKQSVGVMVTITSGVISDRDASLPQRA